MKKLALLVVFCVSVAVGGALAVGEAKLLRYPAYHNGKVAFSYMGDIWIANEDGTGIQRLTVNVGRSIVPRFSPDGKMIAFSSKRHGNYDVYVMPATGGEATQLTFNSADDMVVGWTPDGKNIIFRSARGLMYPGITNLYTVPVTGGLEQALPTDWGYSGTFSPDGKRFAFNRHPMVWWRQHYRGSYAADLWVMDVASKKYTHLGDDEYKGNYFWPMIASNGDIYFVSDRLANERGIKPGSKEVLKSLNNIWKLSAAGAKPVQVTHHNDGRLFSPSISADGRTIVYEENFGLWKLDVTTGKTSEIKLNILSDSKENDVEVLTVRNDADSYDLSPSGRRAAISTHGEIFTVATDRGDVQRVTASFSREMQPAWSPDGHWIAFISDKSGQEEVWIARENGTGLKKLSDSATEKSAIHWAPDSKSLIYSTSDNKLNLVNLETGATKVLLTGEASGAVGAQFSPDGRWIAYAMFDNDLRPHVYVMPATGGETRHVGSDDVLFSEFGPAWTPDGKRLLFLAGTGQRGNAGSNDRPLLNIYSVALTKEDKNLADHGIDSEEEAQAAERLNRQRGEGTRMGGEAPKVEVKIDFDGIERRARQVSRLADSITQVVSAPDSRTYAFVAVGMIDGRPTPAVYTIAEDGSQLTRITQALPPRADEEGGGGGGGFFGGINTLRYSRDGRTLYFHEGSGIYSVSLGPAAPAGQALPAASAAASGAAGAPRSFERRRITFTCRVDVDHRAEREQVFNESWRIMRDRFYDADMHGVDWARARETYAPLMQYVADQEEMHDLISEMIGELNASHTGISYTPTAEERDHFTQTRYPGFEMTPSGEGYYKVSFIYRNGPADHDYVKLDAGNYVLAVDGHELKSGDNYWKWYGEPRGQKMEFLVNSKPTAEGAWKTYITPISSMAYQTLQYERWVDQRREMVSKLSNGEIGYLHIRSMNDPSLRKFERDLVENHFKKALIIDQRFNPGGGIDQELLEILSQKQYQKTRGRGSVMITRPQAGFFGPMVVMENERSTSDAEVFPDGFRTLGLGKVVGVTTYGAVIGTGAYRLLDGSSIRTPGSGLWNVKGYNLENYGVPPDVYVDNTPEDFFSGRDEQIEKAVEPLKQELQQKSGRQAAAGGR